MIHLILNIILLNFTKFYFYFCLKYLSLLFLPFLELLFRSYFKKYFYACDLIYAPLRDATCSSTFFQFLPNKFNASTNLYF